MLKQYFRGTGFFYEFQTRLGVIINTLAQLTCSNFRPLSFCAFNNVGS